MMQSTRHCRLIGDESGSHWSPGCLAAPHLRGRRLTTLLPLMLRGGLLVLAGERLRWSEPQQKTTLECALNRNRTEQRRRSELWPPVILLAGLCLWNSVVFRPLACMAPTSAVDPSEGAADHDMSKRGYRTSTSYH